MSGFTPVLHRLHATHLLHTQRLHTTHMLHTQTARFLHTHMTHLKSLSRKFMSSTTSLTSTYNYAGRKFKFFRASPVLLGQIRDHCPRCLSTSTSNHESQEHKTETSDKTIFHNQPPSWLYVSDKNAYKYRSMTKLDLGLSERLAGVPGHLQDNIDARGITFDLRGLVTDYEKMLLAEERLNEMEREKELVLKQRQQTTDLAKKDKLTKQWKEMKEKSSEAKSSFNDLEECVYLSALRLPNDLHPDTPTGQKPVILREKEGTRTPQSMNHVEAGETYGLIKFSNVGPRAYYLRGELAVAEWTISDLASDFIEKQGFRRMAGPEFFKSQIVESCGRDYFNTDEVLTIHHVIKDSVESMNHLGGVSPMAFVGYVAKLCIADSALPFNMFSCSKTYHKSDLPGLFGATQSTQVGLFSCVTETDVDHQFEVTTEIVWKLLQSLGFSLRLVQIPACQLRGEERRRVELQVFAPSLEEFISIGHVSDLGDFVSRRLQTSHNVLPTSHKDARKLHMISGTVVNITSLLAVWLEHTDLSAGGLM